MVSAAHNRRRWSIQIWKDRRLLGPHRVPSLSAFGGFPPCFLSPHPRNVLIFAGLPVIGFARPANLHDPSSRPRRSNGDTEIATESPVRRTFSPATKVRRLCRPPPPLIYARPERLQVPIRHKSATGSGRIGNRKRRKSAAPTTFGRLAPHTSTAAVTADNRR